MNTTKELIAHEWNEHGVAIAPELIEIPGMPKGCTARVELAVDPEGKWRAGYDFTGKDGRGAAGPSLNKAEAHETRFGAIRAALVIIGRPFLGNKKATAALDAFYAHVGQLEAKAEPVAAFAPDSLIAKSLAVEKTLAEGAPLPKGRYADIPVAAIRPNPENHRKTFDPDRMRELQESIVQVGQLQAIAVRQLLPEELGELPGVSEAAPAASYEIILGERRWRAHFALGRETIEGKIYEGLTRKQAKAAALVENLQRAEINPIEEAEGFRDLIEAEQLTQEECAKRVGRSRPTVANALRILRLPEGVVDLIRAGKLTPAHGHALARWEKRPLVLMAIAEQVITNGTSAGELEDYNRANDVPFSHVLGKADLYARIDRWNKPGGWDRSFPAEILDHPDYEREGDGEVFRCWNTAHWREVVAKENAKIEAERAAAVEAAKTAKPVAIKSLSDLKRGTYEVIAEENVSLFAGLLPSTSVQKLAQFELDKDDPKDAKKPPQVTVCMVPKFAKRVADAYEAARSQDRLEKLPAIHAKARAAVRKWKRIGPRELAVIAFIMALDNDCYDGGRAAFAPACAAASGVKLPACFVSKLENNFDSYASHEWAEDRAKGFRAFAEGDAIGYIRTLVDTYLVSNWLKDASEWDGLKEPEAEAYYWRGHSLDKELAMLRHILDTEELGLLEETKAGRKALAEQVKAQDWYAAARAEAEQVGDATTAEQTAEDEESKE